MNRRALLFGGAAVALTPLLPKPVAATVQAGDPVGFPLFFASNEVNRDTSIWYELDRDGWHEMTLDRWDRMRSDLREGKLWF